MNVITVPRLRNKQLQSLSESSLEICKNSPELKTSTENVSAKLEIFKKGMLKDQASAAKKTNLDYKRDKLISGFIHNVKSELNFPHEEGDTKTTLLALYEVVKKYGSGIIRLPANEESAAVDNLLADINKLDLTSLETSGISRWIVLIMEANNDFKAESREFISDSAEASGIDSASSLVPALTDALEGLFTMLFANIKLTPTDALLRVYAETQELLDSYR